MDSRSFGKILEIASALMDQGVEVQAVAHLGAGFLIGTPYSPAALHAVSEVVRVPGYTFAFIGVGIYSGSFVLVSNNLDKPFWEIDNSNN